MNDKAIIEAEPIEEPRAVQVFNPLDAPVQQFSEGLVQRQANYDALALHLRGMLVPDHDFGKIHVVNRQKCPRPWECTNPGHFSSYQLFAPGADKVLGILGLACQYPGEQDFMRAALTGKPILEVITKCQIIDHRGNVIAEEYGACARSEVNDSLNNALKRANKRARVGAVLRLPAISALFESDFLAEVAAAAAKNGGNTTNGRARSVNQEHNTGKLPEVIPIGKHKGKRFTEVDDGWLMWAVQTMTGKPDVQAAAERELNRRQSQGSQSENAPAGSTRPHDPDLPPVDSYEEYDDGVPL